MGVAGQGAGAAELAAPAEAPAPLVIQVPEGGRAVPVVDTGVVCGAVPEGFALEADGRSIRPPTGESTIGRSVAVRVAPNKDACASSQDTRLLVVTGRWPEIDPASVVFFPDEGRVEARGQRMHGAVLSWQNAARSGQETCLEPTVVGKQQACVWPVAQGAAAETTLRWGPAGLRPAVRSMIFDLQGSRAEPSSFTLRPARFVLSRVVSPSATVDISLGPGRVALLHAGSAASVDCGLARCDLEDGALLVRSVPTLAGAVSVRMRLAPRFVMAKGDSTETTITLSIPLVHCQLTLVSGDPIREAEDASVILRLDPRCKESRPRWLVDGEVAEALRYERSNDVSFVQVRTGRLFRDRVVITATRGEADGTIIGQLSARTAPPPRPRVSLDLPRHGKIEFIPSNRAAVLLVAELDGKAHLAPMAVEGAYTIEKNNGQTLIRGDENAGGFVSLRFAYRVDGLPDKFAGVNLAVISERVQRQVREASTPAPFSTTADGADPLVELQCLAADGKPKRLMPGRPNVLNRDEIGTCRIIVHRERLRPEDGTQEIVLDVDVTRAEGGRRGEASLSERMVLRPGGEPRAIPLRGGLDEFDQIQIRVSHVVDESRYVLAVTGKTALPAVQWSVRVQGGRMRLYATAAIPAGLYRLNNPTGQLTLNFGVLSRLVWLDNAGKESLLGAEMGLMGMGLIQRPGSLEYPATLGAIVGMGIRVPLGGGAAVGVHLWGAYEFRDPLDYKLDAKGRAVDCMGGTEGCRKASRFALIFGPSISIGNVGTNL